MLPTHWTLNYVHLQVYKFKAPKTKVNVNINIHVMWNLIKTH